MNQFGPTKRGVLAVVRPTTMVGVPASEQIRG
jgi:hypothetical protein